MSSGGATHAECKAARIHRFQSDSGLIQQQKGSSLFVSVSASGSKREVMKEASRAGRDPETTLIQHLCSACVSAPPPQDFFFTFLYPVGLHASSTITTTATQPHPEAGAVTLDRVSECLDASALSHEQTGRLDQRCDWLRHLSVTLTPRNRCLRLKFPFNYCYFFFSRQLVRFA